MSIVRDRPVGPSGVYVAASAQEHLQLGLLLQLQAKSRLTRFLRPATAVALAEDVLEAAAVLRLRMADVEQSGGSPASFCPVLLSANISQVNELDAATVAALDDVVRFGRSVGVQTVLVALAWSQIPHRLRDHYLPLL